ncbi:MAG: hypothetical protein PHV79_00445, partial [Clostridia bacterium]|nr:hypothetical protein [Clostridia bacterium]
DQISTISPLLGENTLLFLLIAVILIIALFIFVMVLIFGDFGYLAGLSLAIYFALIMFFMQAVPIFVLSISGIIGALIGLLLLFSSFYIIFDNIKSGYTEGKKIPLSAKSGFSKSIMTIVDLNVIAIIFAIIIYFVGAPLTHSFAFALGLGALLNMPIALLTTKLFTKWYLSFNSTKPNKLRMKREATINELD